jgi:hypothetical protein
MLGYILLRNDATNQSIGILKFEIMNLIMLHEIIESIQVILRKNSCEGVNARKERQAKNCTRDDLAMMTL